MHSPPVEPPLARRMSRTAPSLEDIAKIDARDPEITYSPSRTSDLLGGTPRSSTDNHSGGYHTLEGSSCSPTYERHEMRIRLGFCCMAKKMKQPTMMALHKRFEEFGNFILVLFEEDMILNQDVSEWPSVDCMIAFNSGGFPLEKAIQYAQLHPHTFYLTHPASQRVLLDRRMFYSALRRNNIPMSKHVYCSRDGYLGATEPIVEEFQDRIVINGVTLDKPFVEKPADSEDHRVRIYYHSSQGGGCREMFRKVKNQSSAFLPDVNTIRRDGSYVYEEYIECIDKMDVKCYTVGANYVHAESRKAPTGDGVVLRDENGKEIRETVTLTPAEMMVARKVSKVFRQLVCGFDILRSANGSFYVCDVNGWSFVKQNQSYVDTASSIMRDIFEEKVAERGLHRKVKMDEKRNLLGVICVARHADRTPKQKVKLFVSFAAFCDCVFDGDTKVTQEVVIKSGHPMLTNIAEQVTALLSDIDSRSATPEPKSPLHSRPADNIHSKAVHSLRLIRDVLDRDNEGLKIQLKPCQWDEEGNCLEVQLVCKWGGWLTEAGAMQATMLGEHFAKRIYTRTDARHLSKERVSICLNNERRVLHTAINFTSAFLKDSSVSDKDCVVDEALLGDAFQAKDIMGDMSRRIDNILHCESLQMLGTDADIPGLHGILNCVALKHTDRTPLGALKTMHYLLKEFVEHIPASADLYRNESIALMKQRWVNILRAFQAKGDNRFDTSKIPDIFDYVSYDVCYNQEALAPLDLYPLFTLAEALSLFVSAGEYGFAGRERKFTAGMISGPLFSKISNDIEEIAANSGALTRLYFTSESHLMALKNLLYESTSANFHRLEDPMELHFLTHFVIKVYNYPEKSPTHPRDNIQIEVHFSPGMDKNMFGINQGHHVEYAAVSPMIRIHNDLSLDEVQSIEKEYTTLYDHYRIDRMAARHMSESKNEGK